jgi:integrase
VQGRTQPGDQLWRCIIRPAPTGDAARKAFHELEAIAEVPSVRGRGWYGVRRTASDVAEDLEKDERVLNSISGHRNSTTRRLVYHDRERPEVLNRAAITRAKVRQGQSTASAALTRPR